VKNSAVKIEPKVKEPFLVEVEVIQNIMQELWMMLLSVIQIMLL